MLDFEGLYTSVSRFAKRQLQGDIMIWLIVGALMGAGIWLVYSTSGNLAYRTAGGNTEYYLWKHGGLCAVSFFAMWVTHKMDYRIFPVLAKFGLYLSVPLLVFTWLFGANINDASRWVEIPGIGIRFQPSDLAKLALISSLASMLSKKQNIIQKSFKEIWPMLAWVGLICGLIAMTDLSSAGLLFSTCMLVMFIGRVPVKRLGAILLVGITVGAGAIMIGQRGGTFVSRIKKFVDPTEIPFQAEQSYIAIAKGGFKGVGPGNSEQKNFLPHPYSDFIYAIVIEEYGMGGGIFVLLLYLALLYRGLLLATKSERPFAGLLAAGLTFSIVLQAFVNMGVVVGLLPVTGLTLPLISMGGTSLLFTGVSLGIVLSVSRGHFQQENGVAKEEVRGSGRRVNTPRVV